MAMIRMRYDKQYRDRTGKMRYYLRHPGSPKVPLPGLPGSAEFMAAYSAGMAGSERPKVSKGGRAEGRTGHRLLSIIGVSKSRAIFANTLPVCARQVQHGRRSPARSRHATASCDPHDRRNR